MVRTVTDRVTGLHNTCDFLVFGATMGCFPCGVSRYFLARFSSNLVHIVFHRADEMLVYSFAEYPVTTLKEKLGDVVVVLYMWLG